MIYNDQSWYLDHLFMMIYDDIWIYMDESWPIMIPFLVTLDESISLVDRSIHSRTSDGGIVHQLKVVNDWFAINF